MCEISNGSRELILIIIPPDLCMGYPTVITSFSLSSSVSCSPLDPGDHGSCGGPGGGSGGGVGVGGCWDGVGCCWHASLS